MIASKFLYVPVQEIACHRGGKLLFDGRTVAKLGAAVADGLAAVRTPVTRAALPIPHDGVALAVAAHTGFNLTHLAGF